MSLVITGPYLPLFCDGTMRFRIIDSVKCKVIYEITCADTEVGRQDGLTRAKEKLKELKQLI